MLLGLDIDTWYKLVAGAMVFAILMLLVACIINSFREWFLKKRESNNDSSQNKS
jgi:hypothetical protein